MCRKSGGINNVKEMSAGRLIVEQCFLKPIQMYTQEVIEILIVEDDPFQAQLSISALQEKNISNTIVHLKNGAEALDYLFHTQTVAGNQGNENPKVMLLDLRMPLVDGFEVLRRVKSHEKTKEIPVVVFTSSDLYSDERECYTLGAKDYIIKPPEIEAYKNKTYKSITGMLMYASQILVHY
jgi:two-component system, response regulator